VLGSDLSGCSSAALQALFAGKPIKPCAQTAPEPLFRAAPLPPGDLQAVPDAAGNRGRSGRTLEAVALSLTDLSRQFAYQALDEVQASSFTSLSVGGLYAGWAELKTGTLYLHGYVYVPGVRISGTVAAGRIRLTVAGTSAAAGTITSGPSNMLAGVLEGRRLQPIASSAAMVPSE
jgi:hypothetical protein